MEIEKYLKYLPLLPLVLTPMYIWKYEMEFLSAVSSAVFGSLIVAIIAFIFSRLTKKSVRTMVFYEHDYIRLIVWNKMFTRRLFSDDFGEKGLLIITQEDRTFLPIQVIKPPIVENPDFCCDAVTERNRMMLMIDNLPPRCLFEVRLQLSLHERESIFLKSGLRKAPKEIIKRALEDIEFWKPQKMFIHEKVRDLSNGRIYLVCNNKMIRLIRTKKHK